MRPQPSREDMAQALAEAVARLRARVPAPVEPAAAVEPEPHASGEPESESHAPGEPEPESEPRVRPWPEAQLIPDESETVPPAHQPHKHSLSPDRAPTNGSQTATRALI